MYDYAVQQQPIESDSVDKLSPQFNANLKSYSEADDFKSSNSMQKFSERRLKLRVRNVG
jgi:predicted HicB family RNase H-like nuclease